MKKQLLSVVFILSIGLGLFACSSKETVSESFDAPESTMLTEENAAIQNPNASAPVSTYKPRRNATEKFAQPRIIDNADSPAIYFDDNSIDPAVLPQELSIWCLKESAVTMIDYSNLSYVRAERPSMGLTLSSSQNIEDIVSQIKIIADNNGFSSAYEYDLDKENNSWSATYKKAQNKQEISLFISSDYNDYSEDENNLSIHINYSSDTLSPDAMLALFPKEDRALVLPDAHIESIAIMGFFGQSSNISYSCNLEPDAVADELQLIAESYGLQLDKNADLSFTCEKNPDDAVLNILVQNYEIYETVYANNDKVGFISSINISSWQY